MKILKKIMFSACFIMLGAFTIAAQAYDFPLGDWKGNYYINSGVCRNSAGWGVLPGTATLTITEVRNRPNSNTSVQFSGYLKLWGGNNGQGVPAGFEYYSPTLGGTGELWPFESGASIGSTTWYTALTTQTMKNWSGSSNANMISVSHTEGNCKMDVWVSPPTSRKK